MRPSSTLLAVAGWIGVAASVVTLGAGGHLLLTVLESGGEMLDLGLLAVVVVAALGLAGLGLSTTVHVLLRRGRTRAAAVATCVLGLGLFPIWTTGLAWWVPPLPRWLGLLQLPVPLVVLGLGAVVLLRQRRAASLDPPAG